MSIAQRTYRIHTHAWHILLGLHICSLSCTHKYINTHSKH
jgi:hypothetical protein